MDNEAIAEFWDFVQEHINDSQEGHKEYSENWTEDGEFVSCDEPDEHRFLFKEAGATMDWLIKATGTEMKVPPAGPDVVGTQGCGACGHVAPSREAMLRHYRKDHGFDTSRVETSALDSPEGEQV